MNNFVKGILREVGDLNNIEPYAEITKWANNKYSIEDKENKLSISLFFEKLDLFDIRQIKKEISYHFEFKNGSNKDSYINVAFEVNGSETKGTTTSISQYLRILKTVALLVQNFIRIKKPTGICFGSKGNESSKVKGLLYGQILQKFLSSVPQYRLVEFDWNGDSFKALIDRTKIIKKKFGWKQTSLSEKILREWDDSFPNTPDYPGMGSNDFTEYMAEADTNENTLLSQQFLVALYDYAVDGDRMANNRKIIEQFAQSLPSEFKTAPEYIYRAVNAKKNFENFGAGVRSWTKTPKEAAQFAEQNGLIDKAGITIIFKLKVEIGRIVLNLDKLIHSSLYAKSVNSYKNVSEVIGNEGEIFYNQPEVTKKNISLLYDRVNSRWIKYDTTTVKKKSTSVRIDDLIIGEAYLYDGSVKYIGQKGNKFVFEYSGWAPKDEKREIYILDASQVESQIKTDPRPPEANLDESTLADKVTMETGAIPNSLDEVEEVLKELEEGLNNPHHKNKWIKI